LVPANGITATQIAADAVGSSEIAADAVGYAEMQDNAVGNDEMRDDAVTTTEILNGTILPADINATVGSVNQVLAITAGSPNTVAWVNPATLSTVLQDTDGDTKVEVENTPDADQIRFSTGSTPGTTSTIRMVIDQQGNVGIGNNAANPATAQSARLVVRNDMASAGLGTDLNIPLLLRNTTATNNSNSGTGIGFNNYAQSAAPKTIIYNERTLDYNFRGKLHFILNDAQDNTPATLADSKMTIQADGNVGIGNVSPTYKLQVNGKVKSNGINETSDARLKKNVSNIDNALQMVMSLNGKTYNWRTDEYPEMSFNAGRQYGFIAQEVEKIIPEVVGTDNDGWKSIEYSHLVPVLLEAIKEQQTMIESLKKENTEYSDALNTLKAEVSKNASLINVLLEQSAPASSMKQ
jgi:hypothetical protein